jgi:hypothetical protein
MAPRLPPETLALLRPPRPPLWGGFRTQLGLYGPLRDHPEGTHASNASGKGAGGILRLLANAAMRP